jgi:hypothetical protein
MVKGGAVGWRPIGHRGTLLQEGEDAGEGGGTKLGGKKKEELIKCRNRAKTRG